METACFMPYHTNSPKRDFEVRSLLVRFENLNASIFSPLLTTINAPDMNSHIKKLHQPGIWGTHVELLAAATYFRSLYT